MIGVVWLDLFVLFSFLFFYFFIGGLGRNFLGFFREFFRWKVITKVFGENLDECCKQGAVEALHVADFHLFTKKGVLTFISKKGLKMLGSQPRFL